MNARWDSLNLHHLRILNAVVEQGSVSRAADALNLTQPAVSAQLRHLRRFAGTPIFAREGRRIILTEVGQAVLQYTKDVLGATDALTREIDHIASGERDHFLIGGPLVHTTYVLPQLLAEFKLRHPSVQLSMISGSRQEIIERIRARRVDIGVVRVGLTHRPLPAGIIEEPLCDDELVVIEAAEQPFSRGQVLTVDQLTAIPFIRLARPEAPPDGVLGRLAAAAGLQPPKFIMHLESWEAIKDAARTGVGAAIVPHSAVQRELSRSELRLLQVQDFKVLRSVDLVHSETGQYHRRSAMFERLLGDLRTDIPKKIQLSAGPPDATDGSNE